MNKSIVSLLILLSLFATAQAQTATKKTVPQKETKQKEQPAVRAKEIVGEINSVCALQGEQATKLTALYQEYYSKHDALKKQKNMLDKNVYSQKNKSLKKNRDEKLMTILTADQFKKWSLNKLDDKKSDKETE